MKIGYFLVDINKCEIVGHSQIKACLILDGIATPKNEQSEFFSSAQSFQNDQIIRSIKNV